MSTYTPTLGLEEIAPGTQAGLWGDTTNNNLRLIDQAVTGVTPLSFAGVSGTTITLDDFNGAPSEARAAVLNITGGATGPNTVIVPNKQKTYLVRNNTGQTITFRTATLVEQVSVAAANSTLIFCDGNNGVFPGIAVPGSGPTLVTGGGTGRTTLTANSLVAGNGTNAVNFIDPGSNGTVLTSNGTTWSAQPVVTSFSAGSTGLTPSVATTGAVSLSGQLNIANGGTGATTNTAARTNLGATTLGANLFTVLNPSAVTFPRFNADNTVSTLSASDFRTAIGVGAGAVTSVTGTSPVISSGGATPAISLASGYGDILNPYSGRNANFVLAAPNGTVGVPTFRALVAADIPTLNQNTTGTASNVTGIVAVVNGGTGVTASTGSGSSVLNNSPQLTLPALSTATVTPAGSSQGAATLIAADINIVATTVSNTGVILPSTSASQVGRRIRIYCDGGFPLRIYPQASGFIDNNTANAFITIFNGAYIDLIATTTTNWRAYNNAISTGGVNSSAQGPNDGNASQIRIITNDGTNVGSKTLRVGTSAGATVGRLEVVNNAYTFAIFSLDDSGDMSIAGATASKATGTTWANPSDVRLKDNIQNYTGGIEKLMQVTPKTWEYNGKGGTTAGAKGLGVVADEIESVLPNTVEMYSAKLNPDDEDYTDIKRFDATEITWLLVNSVKELKAELDAAKAEIAALKAQ